MHLPERVALPADVKVERSAGPASPGCLRSCADATLLG